MNRLSCFIRLSPRRRHLHTSAQAYNQLVLRPYQADCIKSVLNALSLGEHSRLGVSCPTGSGKTIIFTTLASTLPALRSKTGKLATKVLILVGSIELLNQSYETVTRLCPHLTVEREQGAAFTATGRADVTVATYQTLARGDMIRLDKFDPSEYKAVIVDEAHHAAAKSYIGILSLFDPRLSLPVTEAALDLWLDSTPLLSSPSPITSADDETIVLDRGFNHSTALQAIPQRLDADDRPCVPILGFTATFSRADGLALGRIFEKIVYHSDWLAMVDAGWLSQCQFTTVKLGSLLDLDTVTVSKGDFAINALYAAMSSDTITQMTVDSFLEKARDRHSTLVFAINVAHVISLVNEFRRVGVDARFVYAGTPTKERSDRLKEFKAGVYPVLVNCGIFTEGADIPNIDCILLARPTKSQNLFVQMIGRGLRLSPGTDKKDCLIIDLVGNSKRGVVSICSLYGVDPDSVNDYETNRSLAQRARELPEAEEVKVPAHKLEYQDFATIFDFVDGLQVSSIDLSSLAWVRIGDVFILSSIGGGYAKIEKINKADPPLYEATLTLPAPPSRFNATHRIMRRPTLISQSTNLPLLFRTADVYVTSHDEFEEVQRNARWRFTEASDAQKTFIRNKLRKVEFRTQEALGEIFESFVTGTSQMEEGEEEGETREDADGEEDERKEAEEDEEEEGEFEIDGAWVGKPMGTQVRLNELNKGQAADTITRMLHGGITELRKLTKRIGREERAAKVRKKRSVMV